MVRRISEPSTVASSALPSEGRPIPSWSSRSSDNDLSTQQKHARRNAVVSFLFTCCEWSFPRAIFGKKTVAAKIDGNTQNAKMEAKINGWFPNKEMRFPFFVGLYSGEMPVKYSEPPHHSSNDWSAWPWTLQASIGCQLEAPQLNCYLEDHPRIRG